MKYSGELAKGIAAKKLGLLATEEAVKAELHRVIEVKAKKLPALFAAYGVEPLNWMEMVFQLAEAHVPGFKVREPAGRPTEWGDVNKAEFKLTVDGMCEANPGMKITDAIRRVKNLVSWQAKTKDMKVPALSKHYYGADPIWVA